MPDSQPGNDASQARAAGSRSLPGLATAAALLAVVGYVDYVTGVAVSVSFFYLLPICLAVWSGGRAAGVAASVLAVGLWIMGNALCGATPDRAMWWNGAMRLGMYLLAVILLDLLIHSYHKLRNIQNNARWF